MLGDFFKKYSTILDVLKKVTSLNIPVYFLVYRKNVYVDWTSVLKPDGNAEDAKNITDFAVANNVQGVILFSISPVTVSTQVGGDSLCTIQYLPIA